MMSYSQNIRYNDYNIHYYLPVGYSVSDWKSGNTDCLYIARFKDGSFSLSSLINIQFSKLTPPSSNLQLSNTHPINLQSLNFIFLNVQSINLVQIISSFVIS